jgi:hypothetical protein
MLDRNSEQEPFKSVTEHTRKTLLALSQLDFAGDSGEEDAKEDAVKDEAGIDSLVEE